VILVEEFMIDTAHYLRELNPMWESFATVSATLQPVVYKVAPLALNVFAQLALFHFLPNLCVYGFTLGFIFSDQINYIAGKVETVFKSCRGPLDKLSLVALGILAVYAMPAALVVTTAYYSSSWGAYLYQNCHERLQRYRQLGLA
jgi:hypothetical protein